MDFFSSIEEEQTTMFNPQTNRFVLSITFFKHRLTDMCVSPTSNYFQQQGAVNPFAHMMTGQPQLQSQPTGFVMPQHTSFQPAPNPFAMMGQQQQQLQPQPTGHRPFSSFLPPQQTGFMQPQQTGFLQPQQQQPQQTGFLQPQQGFLQPQATGGNPFRQSMLFPQTTGMAMFGVGGGGPMSSQGPQIQAQGASAFGNTGNAQAGSSFFSPSPATATGSAFNNAASPSNVPARPASTPLTSFGSSTPSVTSPPIAQPVKTHQTGTRNPFGPVSSPSPPPVPKVPTLMELAMGLGSQQQQQQQPLPQAQTQQPQPTGAFGGTGGFSFGSSALNPGAADMSSVASSFSFSQNNSASKPNSSAFGATANYPLTAQDTSTTASGSTFSDSLFSSLSSQPTGATNSSSVPSITMTGAGSGPIKSHTTGFGGLKPFKPSSSFGASLLGSLPPIPGSAPATPAVTGNASSLPGTGNSPNGSSFNSGGLGTSSPPFGSSLGSQPTGFGALNAQSTSTLGNSNLGSGSTLGVGLRPQMTGVANPFRASMFSAMPNGGGPSPGIGSPAMSPSPSQPTGFGGMSGGSTQPNQTSLGGGLFGAANSPPGGSSAPFTSAFGSGFSQQQPTQQQGSLI